METATQTMKNDGEQLAKETTEKAKKDVAHPIEIARCFIFNSVMLKRPM